MEILSHWQQVWQLYQYRPEIDRFMDERSKVLRRVLCAARRPGDLMLQIPVSHWNYSRFHVQSPYRFGIIVPQWKPRNNTHALSRARIWRHDATIRTGISYQKKKSQIKEADLIAFVGHDVGFSEPHVWSKVPHATKMAEWLHESNS